MTAPGTGRDAAAAGRECCSRRASLAVEARWSRRPRARRRRRSGRRPRGGAVLLGELRGGLAAGPVGRGQLGPAGRRWWRRCAAWVIVLGGLGQVLGPLGGLLLDDGRPQRGAAGWRRCGSRAARAKALERGGLALGRLARPVPAAEVRRRAATAADRTGRLGDRRWSGRWWSARPSRRRRVRERRWRARRARATASHGAPRTRRQPSVARRDRAPAGCDATCCSPRPSAATVGLRRRRADTVRRAGTRPGPASPIMHPGGGRLPRWCTNCCLVLSRRSGPRRSQTV